MRIRSSIRDFLHLRWLEHTKASLDKSVLSPGTNFIKLCDASQLGLRRVTRRNFTTRRKSISQNLRRVEYVASSLATVQNASQVTTCLWVDVTACTIYKWEDNGADATSRPRSATGTWKRKGLSGQKEYFGSANWWWKLNQRYRFTREGIFQVVDGVENESWHNTKVTEIEQGRPTWLLAWIIFKWKRLLNNS